MGHSTTHGLFRRLQMRLKDKVAVITGAARGIGSVIAKRFAAEGGSVVINYATRKTEAERTLAAIEAKDGKAFIFRADITKTSEVEKLFATTKERFSRLDILVNNAGLDNFMPLERITPMRRVGEPEDIAAAAVLFCSDDARWITGRCVRVSGGLV
jgi:NAD(P)-dependent dehydrogenase (short-subunit alcohol dehydrogenase family)